MQISYQRIENKSFFRTRDAKIFQIKKVWFEFMVSKFMEQMWKDRI